MGAGAAQSCSAVLSLSLCGLVSHTPPNPALDFTAPKTTRRTSEKKKPRQGGSSICHVMFGRSSTSPVRGARARRKVGAVKARFFFSLLPLLVGIKRVCLMLGAWLTN
jgi:hypothetical protein